MRLTLRLAIVMLLAFFRRRNSSIFEESILQLRVMPWDCVWRFMGNDRYYSFMDLGRIDFVLRMGWGKAILKNKWNPFVIGSYIQYRAPLKMFQLVELHTKLIYWDSRFFWMEHEFKRKEKTIALAISKSAATYNSRVVSTSLIFWIVVGNPEKPPCPDKVERMKDVETILSMNSN